MQTARVYMACVYTHTTSYKSGLPMQETMKSHSPIHGVKKSQLMGIFVNGFMGE